MKTALSSIVIAILAVPFVLSDSRPGGKDASSIESLKGLLAKKKELEGQLQAEVEKIIAVQNDVVGNLDSVGNVARSLPGHVDDIPRHIPESQREEWGARWYGHHRAVWGWQPPGGWEHQLNAHMNDHEGGRPRRENVAAAKAAINGNIATVKDKANQIIASVEAMRNRARALTLWCAPCAGPVT